jgi:hypothetical protein
MISSLLCLFVAIKDFKSFVPFRGYKRELLNEFARLCFGD